MTRIDFYVLSDSTEEARLALVCKLAEKACGQAQKVYLYSTDRTLLTQIDARLWDFRALSFVAHRLLPESHVLSSDDNDPVILSDAEPGNDRSLLINLDRDVPTFFSRFARALEIVNKEPEVQAAGRERYRFYKQRGYPLHHHNV
ncbi:MAG: DNA polymerase III subunit chi [Granulosicoccus sp.]